MIASAFAAYYGCNYCALIVVGFSVHLLLFVAFSLRVVSCGCSRLLVSM